MVRATSRFAHGLGMLSSWIAGSLPTYAGYPTGPGLRTTLLCRSDAERGTITGVVTLASGAGDEGPEPPGCGT